MLKVSVQTDISGAISFFDQLKENAPKAISRALNKTATTVRAQAAREITSVGYGIRKSAIKKAISIRKATPSELSAIVRASGKPIPLVNYGARQTKAGVTVAVLNGRKLIKSAFIATMPTGHKGVYLRVGTATEKALIKSGKLKVTKGTKKQYKHGLPIRELFGPSVPNAFVNKAVEDALVKVVKQRFGVVLEQELKFLKLSG